MGGRTKDGFTDIDTNAVHAGGGVEPITGALTPPIHLTTTFERDPDGEYSRGYLYTRHGNPNREALERSLSALEGAAATVTFSSGMAAASSLLTALAPGDHVILPDDCYYHIRSVAQEIFAGWGLEISVVDISDLAAVKAALRPNTRLLWLETPSNPRLKIADLAAAAALAKEQGAWTVCDNTWATSVWQRPLELGIDVSLHSTSKYIAGHSDVLGGALAFAREGRLYEKLRHIQKLIGSVPSPFDCWLTLRGIQTLAVRVRAQTETAGKLAAWLADHPKVEQVHYPGLASHPGHELAAGQMKGFGAMMSFQIKGGREAAFGVTAGVELAVRATSLGGTHTLIEHRASLEGEDSPTPDNLLRMSVGLENVDDLMADLDRALSV